MVVERAAVQRDEIDCHLTHVFDHDDLRLNTDPAGSISRRVLRDLWDYDRWREYSDSGWDCDEPDS